PPPGATPPPIPTPLSSPAAAGTVSAAIPTTASRTLMRFAVLLAALLYLDRVCISQSQSLISAELGLSKTDMGFIMMMFSLAYAIFEVPGGWTGGRIGQIGRASWRGR